MEVDPDISKSENLSVEGWGGINQRLIHPSFLNLLHVEGLEAAALVGWILWHLLILLALNGWLRWLGRGRRELVRGGVGLLQPLQQLRVLADPELFHPRENYDKHFCVSFVKSEKKF